MTHCVEICAKTFYKVYVEDEGNEMTDDEAVERAEELFSQGEYEQDEEMPVETWDIMFAQYRYNFD